MPHIFTVDAKLNHILKNVLLITSLKPASLSCCPPFPPQRTLIPIKNRVIIYIRGTYFERLNNLAEIKRFKEKRENKYKKQLPLQTSLVIILSKNLT